MLTLFECELRSLRERSEKMINEMIFKGRLVVVLNQGFNGWCTLCEILNMLAKDLVGEVVTT
jgi:hypothetical protein